MLTDEEMTIVLGASILIFDEKPKHKKKYWVHPRLLERNTSTNNHLMEANTLSGELRGDGSSKNFLGMTSSDLEKLMNGIGHKIGRRDTNYREAIPVRDRLAVTLRYLATGDSYHTIVALAKISRQSLYRIIPEVCQALIEYLDDYVKLPTTKEEWKMVAHQFNEEWDFPNCVGAVDGRHVQLKTPSKCGAGFYSIVIFAIIDAHYNFISVETSYQKCPSNETVFPEPIFKKLISEASEELPDDEFLPGRSVLSSPYVFIGEEALPLKKHVMKPYAGVQKVGSKQRTFNDRLNRVINVVENVFGSLSSSFRLLQKPIGLDPQKSEKILLACIYLHNYLRSSESCSTYNPSGTFDSEDIDTGNVIQGNWRTDQLIVNSLIPLENSKGESKVIPEQIRNEFSDYFVTDVGRISW